MHKWHLVVCFIVALVCNAAGTTCSKPPIPSSQSGPAAGPLDTLLNKMYGSNGMQLASVEPDGTCVGHSAHFSNESQKNFVPINEALATQLATLALPSSGTGFTWVFNPSLGVQVPAQQSLGPIYSERANTIGRHRLLLGVTFQHFSFDSLDGLSLKHIPTVFAHDPGSAIEDGQPECKLPKNSDLHDKCIFLNDRITTDNSLDIKLNQSIAYATFGLTSRIDVSIAVPFEQVFMKVASSANIEQVGKLNKDGSVTLPPANCGDTQKFACHFFVNKQTDTLKYTFRSSGDASGIGDVTVRVKGIVAKGEKSALAIGADLRTPTGDEKNLLGAGATGFRPFLTWSRSGRISPHASLGYEWNGRSVLAGDPSSNPPTKGALPEILLYSGGADFGIEKRITLALDLVGQRFRRAPFVTRTADTTCEAVLPCPPHSFANIQFITHSFFDDNASIGLKLNPFGRLLLSANGLIQLDDGGLRSKVVPLLGVSYSF